jgi:hypothetical protein
MSEEAEATDGAGLETALPEAIQTEEKQEERTRPAGYDPVSLEGLPDEIRKPIEQRFGYFMGQIRENKKTLNEYRSLTREQSEKLEEVMSGMGQVVDHLEGKSLAEAETLARQQMKAAHESGDTDGYITANERLTEIKAKKLYISEQQKNQPKTKKEPVQTVQDLPDTPEARAVGAWQDEPADHGGPLRPWAFDSHPDFERAQIEAAAVFHPKSSFANKTVTEKLAEVDRRMGLTRGSSQSVMGGSLTSQRKTQKLTLSPKQNEIATRTKFAGPGKSDAEHIEAYRKQLEKVKGPRK